MKVDAAFVVHPPQPIMKLPDGDVGVTRLQSAVELGQRAVAGAMPTADFVENSFEPVIRRRLAGVESGFQRLQQLPHAGPLGLKCGGAGDQFAQLTFAGFHRPRDIVQNFADAGLLEKPALPVLGQPKSGLVAIGWLEPTLMSSGIGGLPAQTGRWKKALRLARTE
jgi:hypothetical protein